LEHKKEDKRTNLDGFRVGQEFYIVSRLPLGKVAYAHSNNYVYLGKLNRNNKAQRWTFDLKTKTITNGWRKNYSLIISSSGNGPYLQISTTNARWF